ncbi:hypothetical protein EDD18DRAFT_1356872 [Armillaria luteobubalina]|uniref:Uncharacterized protein n=1 Tax=Armillaria luteobubalina TaxID=153913 RepID=A0AA39PZJ7_9AGAR|nr:hypothetical protein EDD18DRAFT_1356872 [Armillaria luteobubalina]
MTATIACQNDILRPPNHPTGADVFLYLVQQADAENILLHPSLWRSLFSGVKSRRSLFLDSVHNSKFESFCHKFMETLTRPEVSWNSVKTQDDGTRRMSLHEALRFGLYDDIETHLLDVLAAFNTFNPASFDDQPHDYEISPRIRLLLAVTNYALSTQTFRAVRWDNASLIPHQCFGIVFFALRVLQVHVADHAIALAFRESAAIYSTICPLVTSQSFASKETCPSPVPWMIRSDVIRILVRLITERSDSSKSWKTLPPEWSASTVTDVVCRLTLDPDTRGNSLTDSHVRASCVVDGGTLLEHNMNNDDLSAIETFTNLDVLRFVAHTMFQYPWCRLIQAYISAICRRVNGSNSETSHAYIDYIHYPQNLYTICAVLGGRLARCTERGGNGGAQKILHALTGLPSRGAAWSPCIARLEQLSKNQRYISKQRFFSPGDTQWRSYGAREVHAIMVRLEKSVAKLKQAVKYSVPAPGDVVFAEDILQPSGSSRNNSPVPYIPPDDSEEYASHPSAVDVTEEATI